MDRKADTELEGVVDRQHGEVNHHLTQLLSGHGSFNACLHRMAKVQRPACQYCDLPHEDALHTISKCRRFTRDREDP